MTTLRFVAVGLVVTALTLAARPARAAGFEPEPGSDDGKSPALAAALAGGAAVLGYGAAIALAAKTDYEPLGLFFASAALGVFGPAAGHIYVGRNPVHPVMFSLGRLAFIAIAFAGIAEGLSHDDETGDVKDEPMVRATIAVGVLGVAGLTIWEVADSYACAKATHGEPATPARSLSLAPFFAPSRSAGGSSAGGLLLSGRF